MSLLDGPAQYVLLLVLGTGVSVYGAIVGVGGGFLLVPALLVLYPLDPPRTITTISLLAVACNAVSGTLAYARQRRIMVRVGWYLGLASVPGAILGAAATRLLPRGWFDLAFGLLLLALLGTLLRIPRIVRKADAGGVIPDADDPPALRSGARLVAGLGLATGFLSSLAGIGGGPILVPLLILVVRLPVVVATATSIFVITQSSVVGVLTHVVAGDFDFDLQRALVLSFGVVLGAQLGVRVSRRLSPRMIVWLLAAGMLVVGLQLVGAGLVRLLSSSTSA